MVDMLPKYVLGTVQPRAGIAGHQQYQFYRVVPHDVMIMSVSLGLQGYTRADAEDASSRYWPCADQLAGRGVDRIVQIGVPPAACMGRGFILDLIAETERRYGVPGGADLEGMIDGMAHLGVRTVALGGLGWSDAVNDVIAAYLADADIEVVGQLAWEDRAKTLAEGLQSLLDLGRATLQAAPRADALFLPGGPWPHMHVVPMLEAEFGKPVFVNMVGLIWSTLRRPGVVPPIQGWGRLLASEA